MINRKSFRRLLIAQCALICIATVCVAQTVAMTVFIQIAGQRLDRPIEMRFAYDAEAGR